MKHDAAEEAALGLLGLHANANVAAPVSDYHHRTTPTIPLKRKSSAHSQPDTPLDHHPRPRPPPPTHISPGKSSASSDAIRCICGYDYDDGFSVACDVCGRWVHAACFEITDSQVPEEFRCLDCDPRPMNKDKAIKLQKARQKYMQEAEVEKQRRRGSPGVERKGRRTSANTTAAPNANDQPHPPQPPKRKRRASMINAPPHATEDELVDIDEPATHSYVHIDHDEIPQQHTRDRLKRLAQHWRGVTALDGDDPNSPVLLTPDDIPLHPHATLRPVPPSSLSHSTLSLHSNPSVRPPTYSVHTTKPIASKSLIAPYVSTIIPSAHYLADPLNAYAHLSMPKPFVHLLGPPLDVALDARTTGQEGRFVRNGCRPNAVLRPVLCNKGKDGTDDWDESLTFGVFALRDLKANEEVVLGWEWDDGSVIHQLPALISSPHLFAPYRFEQFRHQMASMLHTISSTFTTCACGTRVRDCALSRLAEFVDGQIPPIPFPDVNLGPLVGRERGFRTKERNPRSGGMGGVEMANGARYEQWMDSPGAGPSTLPMSGNETQSGTNMRDTKGKRIATGENLERTTSKPLTDPCTSQHSQQSPNSTSTSLRPSERSERLPLDENRLPPKLRKTWMRRKANALQTQNRTLPHQQDREENSRAEPESETKMVVDDTESMPPPPLPPSIASTSSPRESRSRSPSPPRPRPPPRPSASTSCAISSLVEPTPYPTTPFANMTIYSPALSHSSSYFAAANSSEPSSRAAPKPLSVTIPSESGSRALRIENLLRSPILETVTEVKEIDNGVEHTHQETEAEAVQEAETMVEIAEVVREEEEKKETQGQEDDAMDVDTKPHSPSPTPAPLPEIVDASVERSEDRPPTHNYDVEPHIVEDQPILDAIEQDQEPETSSPSTNEEPKPKLDSTPPTDSPQQPPQSSIIISPPVPPPTDQTTHIHTTDDASTTSPVAPLLTPINGASGHLSDRDDVDSTSKSTPAATPSPSLSQISLPQQPQKVKLSLKDFALRKKRKREEEESKPAPPPPPPQTALGEEHEMAQDESPSTSSTLDNRATVEVESHAEDNKMESLSKAEASTSGLDMPDLSKQRISSPPRTSPMREVSTNLPSVEVHPARESSVEEHKPPPNGVAVGLSYEAKVELTEEPRDLLFNTDVDRRHSTPALPAPAPATATTSIPPVRDYNRSSPPRSSTLLQVASLPLARQHSQEDGEILSPPPPKPPPLGPRPHTPPTHPRSYHPPSGNVSPKGHHHTPPSASRRPPPPSSSYRPSYSSSNLSSRPLPSAPRALRTGNNARNHSSASSYSQSHGSSRYSSSLDAPRGPSADRDRDWDRDRDRSYRPSRGRGGWSR